MPGPVVGEDGLARCPWGDGDAVMRAYHDTEWGVPVHGEAAHLERLTLEAFQSGLSWRTILLKRPAFREAFAGFDAERIAAYDERDVVRLMADAGIVRNLAKVNAAITNARATVALRADGGLAALIESHRPDGPSLAGLDRGPAGQDRRVAGPLEVTEEGRLRLRRPDHHVRPHGGHRDRRRPPRGLPPARVRDGVTYQRTTRPTLERCTGSTETLCHSLWGACQRTTDGRRLQPAAVTTWAETGPGAGGPSDSG